MQIETERDLRINQLRLIVFVMLTIFIVILAYTTYWLIDYNKKFGFFVKTDAVVIDHEEIEGIKYDVLNYKIDGIEYKVTADVKSSNDVGDQIVIYYDEENPLGIIYSLDNRRIILPILAGLFGVVAISLLVVYILIYTNNKMSKKLQNVNLQEDTKNKNINIQKQAKKHSK